MKTKEVLLKAADLIENAPFLARRTFRQETPQGLCFCVVGAIRYARDGSCKGAEVISNREERKLANYLGLNHYYDLFEWNDDPDRTREEAVSALREAAEA